MSLTRINPPTCPREGISAARNFDMPIYLATLLRIKTRASGSHQPAERGTVVSLNGDVVVRNGKHSGMLPLLMCDEATGGLHGKTNPIRISTEP